MTDEDRQFVRSAREGWGRVLDYANAPESDAREGAVAVALWAALHVDRLIALATEGASHERGS